MLLLIIFCGHIRRTHSSHIESNNGEAGERERMCVDVRERDIEKGGGKYAQ